MVLTQSGWKFFSDLTIDDCIATRNKSGYWEYVKPTKIISSYHSGLLSYWKNSKIDILVNPERDIWIYDYNKRSVSERVWKFV